MSHPFERIPAGRFGVVFLAFLLVTLAAGSAIVWAIPDRDSDTLFDLALAGTVPRARAILSHWTEYDRVRIAFANGLDYLFGFVLFNTIALGCVWSARVFRSAAFAGAGILLAWLAWASIVLDIPENISYLRMILGTIDEPWPLVLASCVFFRSTVFFVGIFYVELAVLVWLFGHLRSGASRRAV